MFWRYIRSNFLLWFGAIFSVVGLMVFASAAVVRSTAGPTYPLTIGIVFLGSCFFIPGVILVSKQLRRVRRSVAALRDGKYVVGRVEEIVRTNEAVNGASLYRVAWSWQGLDGARHRGESPSMSQSDATHWKRGDEIAAYIHPSDPEFAEADVFGYRAR